MVHASAWTFALMNIFFLAPPFLFGQGAKGMPLVGLVYQPIWGFVFIALGMVLSYALITNWWWLIRTVLTVGLFIKAMFAWGLIFSLLHNISASGVVGLWLGLMIWQSLCLVYFAPEVERGFTE